MSVVCWESDCFAEVVDCLVAIFHRYVRGSCRHSKTRWETGFGATMLVD